jgi:hypothetical protein
VRILPPAPPRPPGVRVRCVRCDALVEVYAIPAGWLDAETFQCGDCMRVVVAYNEFPRDYGRPAA